MVRVPIPVVRAAAAVAPAARADRQGADTDTEVKRRIMDAALFIIVKKPHAERVERQPALAFEKKNLQK